MNMKHSKSVLDVIIEIIHEHPQKQVTLQELYKEVPKKLKKTISADLIRGSITRRTLGTKPGPYRIMFKRVSPSTYKLIE
jgi:hypothetical protein